jgi:uncharacterized protein YhfF
MTIERYWQQYLDSLPIGSLRPTAYWGSFYFGNTPEQAGKIVELVLNGTKTATGSLLWGYQAEGKRLPQSGDVSIVTDGRDPVCIIETVDVRIVPYDQVGEDLAYEGGEGDRSLASWRRIYWEYILAECRRINRAPDRSVPLVMERFRVVYRDPLIPQQRITGG